MSDDRLSQPKELKAYMRTDNAPLTATSLGSRHKVFRPPVCIRSVFTGSASYLQQCGLSGSLKLSSWLVAFRQERDRTSHFGNPG